MNIRTAVAWVVGAAASSLAPSALAETVRLGEVIVTAQKREQALKDVPMAVTAIQGEELEVRSLNSIQDIGFAVPGMAMREDGPGSYTIFLRGLSNQYGYDALVGVYLDEATVTISGYDQMDVRVLDLERIEILKGPQGTLYGQGMIAGAVRYITNKPRLDAFEGRLEATAAWVSDGDSKEGLTGVVNIPVAEDKFALRLAAQVERGGGWQDQPEAGIEDGNNQDLEHVRLKALLQASEALAIEATVAVHSNESRLGLGYENPDRTITVGIDRSTVLLPKEFDYNLYNLTGTYDFGGAELLSSSTYIDHEHQYPFSYIGGDDTFYGGGGFLEGVDDRFLNGYMFAQELRVASKGDGRLDWTAGLYYRKAERDLTAIYDTLYAGVVYPDAFYFDQLKWWSSAAFADVAYDVTDRLQVGAGVRHIEDEVENFDGFTTKEDDFNSTDPRVYASLKASEDISLYASIARGSRSGGFNYGDDPGYGPESLWNYELGAKGTTAGGRFAFEIAAYFSDYDDMLRRGLVFDEGSAQFLSITSNIGKVEVQGLEGGFTWGATDALTLYATAAFIDSEIKEVNATDATSLPGDKVDYVPETSYTLGGQYEFNWSASVAGFARLDFSHRDEVNYTDRTTFPGENVPQQSDQIDLIDARIGARFGKFNVELFGTNLTDENKWIDPYHAWANANRTRPRTVGLQVGIDFN